MLVEKDLKKIFQQLLTDDTVHVDIGGSDVSMRVFDKASKLALKTPVYIGDNFIPKSVRTCISLKPSFNQQQDIKTYLTVDETRYQIYLNYLGTLDSFQKDSLKTLLEDFSFLADEWRLFLDEHDKNDLIHIRVK